jgi:DNA polymerase theta
MEFASHFTRKQRSKSFLIGNPSVLVKLMTLTKVSSILPQPQVFQVIILGGKSVVAEILMIKNILTKKKRGLYVLPFVSIVMEKAHYLQTLLGNVNIKIQSFHSQGRFIINLSIVEAIWSPNTDIAICTIEKANSLINRLIEEK